MIRSAVIAFAFAGTCMAETFGPTPYLCAGDSPFEGIEFEYFHLEDFEDVALNTPGVEVTTPYGVGGNVIFSDSVDCDDGAIDGNGNAGNQMGISIGNHVDFVFDDVVLGALPSHVGIVWTDVGSGGGNAGNVSVFAYDEAGLLVAELGPVAVGDGFDSGQTDEDRFLGLSHDAGIATFVVEMDSSDFSLDHLQYGRVPTPPVCNADLNGDGLVDSTDLAAMLGQWGACE